MSHDDKERTRRRHQRQVRHLESYADQKARKARRHERGRWRDEDSDPDTGFAKMHRRPPGATGKRARPADEFVPNSAEFEGTVIWLGRNRARVLAVDGEHDVGIAPAIAAARRSAIAIGDEVVLHERHGADSVVARVLPRRSELARAEPGGDEGDRHVLAANIDVVVLVLTAERLRTGLIDRLLVATKDSGAELLVCVNKCDLPHEPTELTAALAPYRAIGCDPVLASALRGDGLDELRAVITGRTAAFVGHSGVGKSTLLNCLDPASERATGAVRESDGRGRHTTTASSLRRLDDGTRLVDTPGVRMFGLVAEASAAEAAFPDVFEFAASCRFRDCRHLAEPGCAVRAAVLDGRLDPARHAAYSKLVADDDSK